LVLYTYIKTAWLGKTKSQINIIEILKMTILQVNLGTYANDGNGDDLRTAFEKSNNNFNELDLTRVITADNLGTGAPVFKEKIGNNLQLRTIKQGLNIFVTYGANEITISTPDSINAVEEDANPRLGGNLDLNSRNIIGTGNIYIDGDVAADNFLGPLTGNVTGNVTGNLTGNVTGNLTGNVTGNLTGNVTGNVTGDLTGDVTGNLYGNVVGNVDAVSISTVDLIASNNIGASGTITSTAGFIGALTGNVTGQVSDITNHPLSALSDVNSTVPTSGQALVWSGTAWGPGTITAGVSRIIAGSNVSISPTSGLGEVTISSLGGGGGDGDLDFGSFLTPSGFSLDLGSF